MLRLYLVALKHWKKKIKYEHFLWILLLDSTAISRTAESTETTNIIFWIYRYYNPNIQKLLNLRKSYVPIVLSVTPDNFWRHRNHLFHGTQNHQNSVVSVDSAPLPWQSRIHRITLFWHFFKFGQNSKFFSSICGFCCARVGGQNPQIPPIF